MVALFTIAFPLMLALVALVSRRRLGWGRRLLALGVAGNLFGTVVALAVPRQYSTFALGETVWLQLDKGTLNSVFALLTSALFMLVVVHLQGWWPQEEAEHQMHATAKPLLSEGATAACLLGFLASMSTVIWAANLGLMWVAVEATTLATAPLISFKRTARSLEAMWKYLLICSVGIGLALLGTVLLSVSAHAVTEGLGFAELSSGSEFFHRGWFKVAFLLALAGFGTKMGLAPFHTWLPDAHSEAPAPVSALLSGTLLNGAFLGIVRFTDLAPRDLHGFCQRPLLALGLTSLVFAAVFVIRQHDCKRMLAYSSVEHMGLLAIMLALTLDGGYFSRNWLLLHAVGHSLIKVALFLLAGNILLGYGSRQVDRISGLPAKMPLTAVGWLLGLLMICGVPPSPLFLTEFMLAYSGGVTLAITVLLLLMVISGGMLYAGVKMCLDGSESSPKPAAVAADRLCGVPHRLLIIAAGLGLLVMWSAVYTGIPFNF